MPPILLLPLRDPQDNFSRQQYQQIALQRSQQICNELSRIRPPRVKVCVQGAKKKKIEGRKNCWRMQGSIAFKSGYRVLHPTLQVLPPSDEWLPFTGMQQITVRKTIKDVDIHSKCTTTATGLPSRVAPGMFEIKTLRLDIYVQVMNPTGWQRQTVALQVGYAWVLAHIGWAFGRDKAYLLGKKLNRLMNRPLGEAAQAAWDARAAAREQARAEGQQEGEGEAQQGAGAAAGAAAAGAGEMEAGGDDDAEEEQEAGEDFGAAAAADGAEAAAAAADAWADAMMVDGEQGAEDAPMPQAPAAQAANAPAAAAPAAQAAARQAVRQEAGFMAMLLADDDDSSSSEEEEEGAEPVSDEAEGGVDVQLPEDEGGGVGGAAGQQQVQQQQQEAAADAAAAAAAAHAAAVAQVAAQVAAQEAAAAAAARAAHQAAARNINDNVQRLKIKLRARPAAGG